VPIWIVGEISIDGGQQVSDRAEDRGGCAAGSIDSTTAWPGGSRLSEEAEVGVKWKVQRG
jgi:hypothetical protein